MARGKGKKAAARRAVQQAVRKGTLTKPVTCPQCGWITQHAYQMHGHHLDYERPLEVMWLCERCHNSEHKRLVSLSRAERRYERDMRYREWIAREFARLYGD